MSSLLQVYCPNDLSKHNFTSTYILSCAVTRDRDSCCDLAWHYEYPLNNALIVTFDKAHLLQFFELSKDH